MAATNCGMFAPSVTSCPSREKQTKVMLIINHPSSVTHHPSPITHHPSPIIIIAGQQHDVNNDLGQETVVAWDANAELGVLKKPKNVADAA